MIALVLDQSEQTPAHVEGDTINFSKPGNQPALSGVETMAQLIRSFWLVVSRLNR